MSFNFDCKHRLGELSPAICKWQSCRLGQVIKTTNIFCKYCPENVRIHNENSSQFLVKCLHRRYQKDFVCKILNKYRLGATIHIPECWKEIFTKLSYLKNEPWLIDIGMTGSTIVEGLTNHKDYDILLWISDIDKYVEWSLKNKLPETIGSKKTDFYIFTEPDVQFFVSLWPNLSKVYIHEYFKSKIKVNENIEIQYTDKISQIWNILDLEC